MLKRTHKILIFSISACVVFMLHLGIFPTRLNIYEAAQYKTVLIDHDRAQGSGVMIRRVNADGHVRWFVWTTSHVVEGVNTVKVIVIHRTEGHKAGRTIYKARLMAYGSIATGDLALLQVDAPPDAFTPAEFATGIPKVGDVIFAVGNMRGENFDGAVSFGNVAQIGIHPDKIDGWPWEILDQTTAPVYPGNSGGPVFDRHNRVLGLIVGGLDATLNGYVPVRAIEAWAKDNWVLWAVRGEKCPSDKYLDSNFTALTKLEP